MKEVAFEMEFTRSEHLMSCWGEGREDRETQALGMGTGRCLQRTVTVWLDSVIFLKLGCALELSFKYRHVKLHSRPNTLECFMEGLNPPCFCKAPKIILGRMPS